MTVLVGGIFKKKKKKNIEKKSRFMFTRGGGCGWELGRGELDEDGQKVQTPIYKINSTENVHTDLRNI